MIECTSTAFEYVGDVFSLRRRRCLVNTWRIQLKRCICSRSYVVYHESILDHRVGVGHLGEAIDCLWKMFAAFNDVTVFPLTFRLNFHSLSILFRLRTQLCLLLSIFSAAIHSNLESIQVFLLFTSQLHALLLK